MEYTAIEKEIQSQAELIEALRLEKMQLVGMILRIRKAFYEVGTTKAMRETMSEVNDEFRIMRGDIRP